MDKQTQLLECSRALFLTLDFSSEDILHIDFPTEEYPWMFVKARKEKTHAKPHRDQRTYGDWRALFSEPTENFTSSPSTLEDEYLDRKSEKKNKKGKEKYDRRLIY